MIRTGRSHDRGPLTEVAVGATSVLFDRQGSLWISSAGDGLRRITYPGRVSGQHIAHFGSQAEQFTKKDGLSHDYVLSALEDREGNIWFVTVGGLDRFRESKVTPVSIPDGDQPRCLLATRDGSIWTGALNRIPQQIGLDGIPKVRADIEWGVYPTALFEDRAGSLWLANGNVVGRLVGNSVEFLHLPKGLVLHFIGSIEMDHAGGLWLMDWDKGVFRFASGELTSFADVPELPHQPGFTHADRSGRVWFGYMNGRVTLYQHGHFDSFQAKDGLVIGRILSIVDDRANRVWLAGDGLCKFENGRFQCLRQKDLPMATVAGIAEDEEGFLWLGGNTGVVRIHPDAFDHAVTDPAHRLSYDSYNLLDGLPGGLQLGIPYPKMVRGRDGRIWFATNSGLAFIDPRRIPKNPLPPPVHVEALKVDGKTIHPAEGVALAPHAHNIEIDYTALSLSIPERVLFRYKLEDADTDWQEPGTRRQAFYTNLPPKQYRFRVIACNNDGVWNEAGTSFNFSVDPAYYQTTWFRLSCVVAFLALLGALYQLRLRQLARQFNIRLEERVEERTRIARDLHDTLLQSFHGLLPRLQAACKLLPGSVADARQVLEAALEDAAQAVTQAREAVQGLRAATVVTNDLAKAIESVGQELAADQRAANQEATAFSLEVEGTPRALHPILRDEIYRITVEAVRNAFRHAQARRIEVEIIYEAKLFRVRVRDNGIGMDASLIEEGRAGHFGLAGMRERARRIGGQLEVWSAASLSKAGALSTPRAGTEVQLIVPGSVLYRDHRSRRFRLFRSKLSTNS